MKISIPTRIIYFNKEELDNWVMGNRENCQDPYCKKLSGSKGFGEYIAGRYFESFGYEWIHHDYNLFGGNKLGKYPKAEAIFRSYFGDDRYEKGRGFYPNFSPFIRIEEPDLLVYKPDYSEVLFVECKRMDTKDKLRVSQIKGLALLKLLFDCPVEVIEIVEGYGEAEKGEPLVWEL
ncbi:hypothetical protein IMZ31_11515 [Pontibacillus sp. ALD_SL1]|uniref:hypothetical protein n=1 Tax=Pontibacillus sp. ALD_SL1 TaxID=2777185 RepID=UPI001A95B8D7|nr:hypothetical protein [Pontibacillus sp. ALD_SL1]QSS98735.1 hypothetical protein IMZ31_11515 [Pontibacillus sp. ALD_SL1]